MSEATSQRDAVARRVRQMVETTRQREAVARLTTFCERLIEAGKLPGALEAELRLHTNAACAAFDMPQVYERNATVAEPLRAVLNSFSPMVR